MQPSKFGIESIYWYSIYTCEACGGWGYKSRTRGAVIPKYEDLKDPCPTCLGTGLMPIPYTEFFEKSRWYGLIIVPSEAEVKEYQCP